MKSLQWLHSAFPLWNSRYALIFESSSFTKLRSILITVSLGGHLSSFETKTPPCSVWIHLIDSGCPLQVVRIPLAPRILKATFTSGDVLEISKLPTDSIFLGAGTPKIYGIYAFCNQQIMFLFKPQNCKWILSSPGFPNTGHLNDLWTYMLLSYGPQLITRVFKLENNSPLLSIQESRHRSLKFTRYRFSGKKPSPRSSKVGCLSEAQILRRSCRNVGMKSTKRNASSESDLYLNRLHLSLVSPTKCRIPTIRLRIHHMFPVSLPLSRHSADRNHSGVTSWKSKRCSQSNLNASGSRCKTSKFTGDCIKHLQQENKKVSVWKPPMANASYCNDFQYTRITEKLIRIFHLPTCHVCQEGILHTIQHIFVFLSFPVPKPRGLADTGILQHRSHPLPWTRHPPAPATKRQATIWRKQVTWKRP